MKISTTHVGICYNDLMFYVYLVVVIYDSNSMNSWLRDIVVILKEN